MNHKPSSSFISIFTKDEDEYIKDNYQTKTSKEIGEVLGYKTEQIASRAARLGLHKQRVFNKRYFKNIDTPEKAYWLGLLYADGYVIYNTKNRNYEISIELQREDKYILEQLNSVFGDVFEIKNIDSSQKFIIDRYCDTHSSVLRMYSKQMALDLIQNGVVQNKTYKEEYPIVDDYLFIDFFRGYFDGNGCIYGTIYYKKRRWRANITTPNYNFALFCQKKLFELYKIDSKIYKLGDLKYRVCICQIGALQKLYEVMYTNPTAPKLLRKYDIYNSNFGPQAEQSA